MLFSSMNLIQEHLRSSEARAPSVSAIGLWETRAYLLSQAGRCTPR